MPLTPLPCSSVPDGETTSHRPTLTDPCLPGALVPKAPKWSAGALTRDGVLLPAACHCPSSSLAKIFSALSRLRAFLPRCCCVTQLLGLPVPTAECWRQHLYLGSHSKCLPLTRLPSPPAWKYRISPLSSLGALWTGSTSPQCIPSFWNTFLADLTYVLCPLRAAARPDPLHSPLEQSPSLTDVCRPGCGEWTLASLCACPWSSKCDSTSLSGV